VLGLLGWQLYVTGFMTHTDAQTMIHYGARKPNLGFPQAPWRLAASIFLHANWAHLIGNLLAIAAWGALLERLLGPLEMLALFLLGGFWGSLLSDAFLFRAVAMGASGGVYAMGAAVMLLALLAPQWPQWQGQRKRWIEVSLTALALNIVLAVAFEHLVSGARLDQWAHLGGAAAGAALGGATLAMGEKRRLPAFWAAALLLAGAAAALVCSRGSSPFAS
jgi:membrane associated rhomboid family serine protease